MVSDEYYKMFKGKRYALVNIVKTLPRAKKIEESLKKKEILLKL
jgi:hypothetical protein